MVTLNYTFGFRVILTKVGAKLPPTIHLVNIYSYTLANNYSLRTYVLPRAFHCIRLNHFVYGLQSKA